MDLDILYPLPIRIQKRDTRSLALRLQRADSERFLFRAAHANHADLFTDRGFKQPGHHDHMEVELPCQFQTPRKRHPDQRRNLPKRGRCLIG
jgi:hypothetical protein